ncbi:hypothetical protein TCAL_07976 [Tigriopus californicus]|uniref:Uncharacterized protein n=1 Tax=Tigriopus californicus TaxID=6832 RepID=A0A553N845_TIGCA|nr:hypothetical protein TCAL_07976 [Tigriopus californicus]|eukprot:TCALIF_07976-PA protein Name:"Protein of unknown function" AED:0.46 eAED:1.00 QI:0/-1/0/1/-1/1/1/0/70
MADVHVVVEVLKANGQLLQVLQRRAMGQTLRMALNLVKEGQGHELEEHVQAHFFHGPVGGLFVVHVMPTE